MQTPPELRQAQGSGLRGRRVAANKNKNIIADDDHGCASDGNLFDDADDDHGSVRSSHVGSEYYTILYYNMLYYTRLD